MPIIPMAENTYRYSIDRCWVPSAGCRIPHTLQMTNALQVNDVEHWTSQKHHCTHVHLRVHMLMTMTTPGLVSAESKTLCILTDCLSRSMRLDTELKRQKASTHSCMKFWSENIVDLFVLLELSGHRGIWKQVFRFSSAGKQTKANAGSQPSLDSEILVDLGQSPRERCKSSAPIT